MSCFWKKIGRGGTFYFLLKMELINNNYILYFEDFLSQVLECRFLIAEKVNPCFFCFFFIIIIIIIIILHYGCRQFVNDQKQNKQTKNKQTNRPSTGNLRCFSKVKTKTKTKQTNKKRLYILTCRCTPGS